MKMFLVLLIVVGLCIAVWLITMFVETVLNITGGKMIRNSKQIDKIERVATLRMPGIWNLQRLF